MRQRFLRRKGLHAAAGFHSLAAALELFDVAADGLISSNVINTPGMRVRRSGDGFSIRLEAKLRFARESCARDRWAPIFLDMVDNQIGPAKMIRERLHARAI